MILLVLVMLSALFFIPVFGYSVLLLEFAAFAIMTLIQFPTLTVFNDRFEVHKKGIIDKFNVSEIYYYTDLKEIEFVKGSMNWTQMIVQSITGTGAQGGFSRPDHLVLKFQDGRHKILYRFGSVKNFREVAGVLENLI